MIVDSMDDGQIIACCLAGEREAFEMIVNKYQARVLSLAWSVLGNRAEAEDTTQEAFIRAYTNLRDFDQARGFKNWLYAIAYKRCLDRILPEIYDKHIKWSKICMEGDIL